MRPRACGGTRAARRLHGLHGARRGTVRTTRSRQRRTSDQSIRSRKLISLPSASSSHSPKTSCMKCAVDSHPPSSSASPVSFALFPSSFFGAGTSSPRRMGPESVLVFSGFGVNEPCMADPDALPRSRHPSPCVYNLPDRASPHAASLTDSPSRTSPNSRPTGTHGGWPAGQPSIPPASSPPPGLASPLPADQTASTAPPQRAPASSYGPRAAAASPAQPSPEGSGPSSRPTQSTTGYAKRLQY